MSLNKQERIDEILAAARQDSQAVFQIFLSEPSCPATGCGGWRIGDSKEEPPSSVDPNIINTKGTFNLRDLEEIFKQEGRRGIDVFPETDADIKTFAEALGLPVDVFYNDARHGREPLAYIGRFQPEK